MSLMFVLWTSFPNSLYLIGGQLGSTVFHKLRFKELDYTFQKRRKKPISRPAHTYSKHRIDRERERRERERPSLNTGGVHLLQRRVQNHPETDEQRV